MANFDCNIYKDLIDRYSSLYQDESRKDVTFVFKDSDEKIKAHKMILEAASPVFKAMFSENFVETDIVQIDDISPEVFELLLSGIYLNDIPSQLMIEHDIEDHLEIYADLYYAAEKYNIKDIRALSQKFMIDNCHAGNTNWLLTKAKLFDLPDLEAKCKDYFQKETYRVLVIHLNVTLDDSYFHEFFDLNSIAVKTEFDLYMALQAIIDNKNLSDYSQCLSKIRFLTIDTIDILNCDLLSSEDKLAVISNIEARKFQKTPKYPMPAHLSIETKPRTFSYTKKGNRRLFWTAIMLYCDSYEDYFEDFLKQMEISADSKERTKSLINEARTEIENGGCPADVILETAKSIFHVLNI